MCLRIYELDVPKFVSDAGLARKVALIKTKKLDFLTDIEMLLMIEKVSQEEHITLHQYTKA